MLRTVSIIAALSLAAAPAFAGDIHEVTVISAKVNLGDLNLSTHRDAVRAVERIARTAERLCAPEGGGRLTVSKPARLQKCEDAAVTKAVAQANSPMLTLALSERLEAANVQVAGR